MASKEDILKKYRANVREKFDMPSLDDIKAITYSDPLVQFIRMSESVGGQVLEVAEGRDLNGTDVGIIRGKFGVAENGCIWIPQQMKEKAVCFISENLVILLPKSQIVNNMHEAYARLSKGGDDTAQFDDYGYGTFISGPSKTADIAQVLVMGAQAARSVTVLLLPE